MSKSGEDGGKNAEPITLKLSLPLACVAFILLLVSILALSRIADSDIWFHLRNAQELVQSHSLPRADSYTFTASGQPLVNHEWLSELPYYYAFRVFGPAGLFAIYFSLLGLIFTGVFLLACWRGASPLNAAVLTAFGVILAFYSFGPRMMHFGWLCLVLVQLALQRFLTSGKGLWLLPIVFAFWVNLHGSWVFGFIVLGIQLACEVFPFRTEAVCASGVGAPQLRKLVLAALVSFAALFLNPYTYRLVWYPFDLLIRQQSNWRNVIEWQPVDFQTGFGKLAFAMILGVMATFLFSRRPWELRDLLLTAFALWASLSHVRFLIFASIVLVPVFAPRIHILPDLRLDKAKSLLTLGLAAVVLATLIATLPSNPELQRVIDKNYPKAALEFIRARPLEGNLLHLYDWGGYIEWHAPEITTFADGRTDIFVYNGVFDDYLKITSGRAPFEVLEKYHIDYVLYPPKTPFTYSLEHSPSWRRIYADETAMMFERLRK